MVRKNIVSKQPKFPKRWITIDPGFNTGIAFWEGDKLVHTTFIKDKLGPKATMPERMAYMVSLLRFVIKQFNDTFNNPLHKYPELVIIEGVFLFGAGMKSITSTRRGDLFKLAYIVGAYTEYFNMPNCIVLIQEAREWKGQLPDAVVTKRVQDYFEMKFKNVHVDSAVGIGLNHIGKL